MMFSLKESFALRIPARSRQERQVDVYMTGRDTLIASGLFFRSLNRKTHGKYRACLYRYFAVVDPPFCGDLAAVS